MENGAQPREMVKLEEVEEEEETSLLQLRKSRTEKNDSKIAETSTVIPGMNGKLSEIEEQAIQSPLAVNGAHKEESTLVNDEMKEKPGGVVENYSENLVFFDKDEGVRHGKMEISSESYNKASEEIESADTDLINEETEYDIETVLQKQDTHDLYCPKCKSCITRRVILRKRKRTKIQNSVKRNKTADPPVQASDDPVHPHHVTGAEEDVVRDSEPDVFRCLSCFSFFIPTGNGFKFWNFGDKSRKEKVRDEQVPRKRNWPFNYIFVPHSQDTAIEQETVENDDTLECKDKILSSPRHVVIHGSGNEPKKITEKIDAKMEQNEVVAGYHLKVPIIGNDQVEVVAGSHLKEPIVSNDQFKVVSDYHLKEPTRNKDQLAVIADYHLKEPIRSKDQLEVIADYHLKEPIRSNEQIEVIVDYHLKEPIRTKDHLAVITDYHLKVPIRSKEQLEVITDFHLKEPIRSKDQLEVIADHHLKEPIRSKEQLEGIGGYHLKEPVVSNDVQATHGSDLLVTTLIGNTEIVIEEPTQDAISVSSKGGSNLVIFSNDGSTTIEKSEEGQIIIQTAQKGSTGKDTVITIDSHPATEIIQGIVFPSEATIPTQVTTQTGIPAQELTEDVRRNSKIEVIKSIVYGGLVELITSLSVVSSAAAGGATTLNILALGMANLVGGFFVICQNLWELRCEQTDQVTYQRDRYQELLGQRQNFKLHAIVCVLSYIVFGLTPVTVYGFSFRQSEERELKLLVVGAVSLVCIIALSVGKAYVRRPPKAYLKTVINFVALGFMASGISYAAGVLVKRILENLGLFQPTSVSDMIFDRDSKLASY